MRASSAGLGLAVVSAATFGTSGTFASALIATGWTPGAAVAVRVSLAALVLTVPALLQLRGRWGLFRANLPVVIAFGGFAVGVAQLVAPLKRSRFGASMTPVPSLAEMRALIFSSFASEAMIDDTEHVVAASPVLPTLS